ncbi:MAG TPA: hypothetical protein VHQ65_00705 [Thermoanaerobaculia bacterium]|nr:hypothetical protein [Thermoanaerobaculia bacterium]
MKRIARAALAVALLAGVAAPAEATQFWVPKNNVSFPCIYGEIDSVTFHLDKVADNFRRGTVDLVVGGSPDNAKVSLAKAYNVTTSSTAWEFTINPYGPQCGNPEAGNYQFRVTHIGGGTVRVDWSQCGDEGIAWGQCFGPAGP